MRKWAQEKTYYQRTKEFSENEQLVFDVLVLSGCSSTYLEKLNLKKWNGESDFVNSRTTKLTDTNGIEPLLLNAYHRIM